MNRKYGTEHFYEAVELLREYFPGCALTCDLITGFPGETEEDHAATLEFIRRCGFSDMHIFPYSRRPGTPADKMEGQCTREVKSRRAKEAQKIAKAMSRDYMQKAVGSILPVLFETEQEGFSSGHSDTYLTVGVKAAGLRGRVENVTICGIEEGCLIGEIGENGPGGLT